jgi:lysophospholipase L1-like esterase
LGGASWSGVSGGSITVTLSGLSVGHQYEVQVWAYDDRASIATRTETLNGSASDISIQTLARGFTMLGRFAIGTFTPDSTSQVFTVTDSSASGPQINALQLRDLSTAVTPWQPPATLPPRAVVWQNAASLAGSGDVATQGTSVLATYFNTSNPGSYIVNGVTFINNGTLTTTQNAVTVSLTGNWAVFGGTANGQTGSYGTILNGAAWGSASQAITLTGLTPWTKYLAQFWLVDGRGTSGKRTTISTTLSDVNVQALSYYSPTNAGVQVVGTFIAPQTGTEVFRLNYGSNEIDTTTFQLRQLPAVALTTSIVSNLFQISWPADHTGWRLMAQTNHVASGISSDPNDWSVVPGSTETNLMNLPFTLAEYYRLANPDDGVSAFKTGNVILFQGDSITDGGRSYTGDPDDSLGQGYAFILGSKYSAMYPDRQLTFINRGISGNTVSNLLGRWQTDTIALKPDILSILIGVNDSEPVAQYQQTYDQLLAQTVAALPNVRLVLCDSFCWPSSVGSVQSARTQAVHDLAVKYHAAVVYFQLGFNDACQSATNPFWIWDGIHPSWAGHQVLADEWVNAVNAFYH